jgi:hypothetical protein
MVRKFVLASLAAVSLSAAALGASTPASANPWGGYGRPHHGSYGGPPPWARAWGWRHHRHRHHHWGHRPPAYGQPVVPPHAYVRPHAPSHAFAPRPGHGYGHY